MRLLPLILAAVLRWSSSVDAGHRLCVPKDFGHGSVVCVCNATYCDTVESDTVLERGSYAIYTSTIDGKRLEKTVGKFKTISAPGAGANMTINRSVTYQEILGFGGAFTDAAGINIKSLSAKTQENLLKSYYSPEGIEYTVGRVPIASCDFSTHPYSYDDNPMDFGMEKFSLTKEDLNYKIPFIIKAQKLSQRNISLFASPWSAPAWMKTNKNMTGAGTLIGSPGDKYYKAWALYFVKFLQQYNHFNISFWGLTVQNEPTDGFIANFSFQCMGWTAKRQKDFIVADLGPTLHQYGFGGVKIMIVDDQRTFVHLWAKEILTNKTAFKYVSGIAVHWYADIFTPANLLSFTHEMFPQKFILATEACEGSYPWQLSVLLGSWERAEYYISDIIQDLNHWVVGWTDWNIALGMDGGPNWVDNKVDSPIIVNSETDEFYKQPMYYSLGHVSKFVTPGSVRLEVKNIPRDLDLVGFIRPDKSIVLIIANRNDHSIQCTVTDPGLGFIPIEVSAHSIQTVVWWT